ncbi:Tyrosine-protein kinase jak2 [Lobulomyces angularis]|nr:Tyrosine-protein kinase jak2 [Lobulomyces angularis]
MSTDEYHPISYFVFTKANFKDNEVLTGSLMKSTLFGKVVVLNPIFKKVKKKKYAQLRCEINHCRIAKAFGILTDLSTLALVMDYYSKSLFDRICDRTLPQLSSQERLQITCEIVEGMCFLHENNIFHYRLQTENILLDSNLKVKINNFFTPMLYNHHETPWRYLKSVYEYRFWLAPEVTIMDVFDFSSDVYSFAVLLTELYTSIGPWGIDLSNLPPSSFYEHCHNLNKGWRLDISSMDNIPLFLQHIMSESWDSHYFSRPSFREILVRLDNSKHHRKYSAHSLRSEDSVASIDNYGLKNSTSYEMLYKNLSSSPYFMKSTKDGIPHKIGKQMKVLKNNIFLSKTRMKSYEEMDIENLTDKMKNFDLNLGISSTTKNLKITTTDEESFKSSKCFEIIKEMCFLEGKMTKLIKTFSLLKPQINDIITKNLSNNNFYEIPKQVQNFNLEELEKSNKIKLFLNCNIFFEGFEEISDCCENIFFKILKIINIPVNDDYSFKTTKGERGLVDLASIRDLIKVFQDEMPKFQSYLNFIKNYSSKLDAKNKMNELPALTNLLQKHRTLIGRIDFDMFLNLPVKHFTDYALHFNAISKCISIEHPIKSDVINISTFMKTLGVSMDNIIGLQKKSNRLSTLTKVVKDCPQLSKSYNRYLLEEFFIPKFEDTEKEGVLFLFNDLIMFTERNKTENEAKVKGNVGFNYYYPQAEFDLNGYSYKCHFQLKDVIVRNYTKNLGDIQIILIHAGRKENSINLSMSTTTAEMFIKSFTKAKFNCNKYLFPSITHSIDNLEEEKVYLVHNNFDATNNLELDLITGQNCKILTKFADGWGEGETQSGKGFFPLACLCEPFTFNHNFENFKFPLAVYKVENSPNPLNSNPLHLNILEGDYVSIQYFSFTDDLLIYGKILGTRINDEQKDVQLVSRIGKEGWFPVYSTITGAFSVVESVIVEVDIQHPSRNVETIFKESSFFHKQSANDDLMKSDLAFEKLCEDSQDVEENALGNRATLKLTLEDILDVDIINDLEEVMGKVRGVRLVKYKNRFIKVVNPIATLKLKDLKPFILNYELNY